MKSTPALPDYNNPRVIVNELIPDKISPFSIGYPYKDVRPESIQNALDGIYNNNGKSPDSISSDVVLSIVLTQATELTETEIQNCISCAVENYLTFLKLAEKEGTTIGRITNELADHVEDIEDETILSLFNKLGLSIRQGSLTRYELPIQEAWRITMLSVAEENK